MKKNPSRREDEKSDNNSANNIDNDSMYYPEDEEDYVPSCTPLPSEEELQQPFIIDQLFEFDAPQYFDFDEFDNPAYQQQYFNISMNPLTGDVTTTLRLLNDVDWFLCEHPELEPLDEVDFSYESASLELSPRSHESGDATTSSDVICTPPNNSYRTPPHTTPAMSPLVFKTPQRRHIATPHSPSLAKLGKAVRIVSASPLAPATPSGLASPLRRPLTAPSPLRVTLTSFTEHKTPFTEHKPPLTDSRPQPVIAAVPPSPKPLSADRSIVPPSPKHVASSIIPPSPKHSVLIAAQPRRIVRTSPTTAETTDSKTSVSTKPATRVTSAVRVAQENRAVNRIGAVTKVTMRSSAQLRSENSDKNNVLKEVTRMLAEHNKKIRDQHRTQVLERAKKPSVQQVKQFASTVRTRNKSTSPLL
jgi:hypothetical protein